MALSGTEIIGSTVEKAYFRQQRRLSEFNKSPFSGMRRGRDGEEREKKAFRAGNQIKGMKLKIPSLSHSIPYHKKLIDY